MMIKFHFNGMHATLTNDSLMPFGKWAGERLADVPDEYWEWLLEQPGFKFKHPALWNYLNDESSSAQRNSRQLPLA